MERLRDLDQPPEIDALVDHFEARKAPKGPHCFRRKSALPSGELVADFLKSGGDPVGRPGPSVARWLEKLVDEIRNLVRHARGNVRQPRRAMPPTENIAAQVAVARGGQVTRHELKYRSPERV